MTTFKTKETHMFYIRQAAMMEIFIGLVFSIVAVSILAATISLSKPETQSSAQEETITQEDFEDFFIDGESE